jgi:hypothetical protein
MRRGESREVRNEIRKERRGEENLEQKKIRWSSRRNTTWSSSLAVPLEGMLIN